MYQEDYPGGRAKGASKWNRTLVHSMAMGGRSWAGQAPTFAYSEKGELQITSEHDQFKREKSVIYGKPVDRKKRKRVLYPDMKGLTLTAHRFLVALIPSVAFSLNFIQRR